MVPTRFILWLMSFFSFTLQYLLLSSLNIAITNMVDTTLKNNSTSPTPCTRNSIRNKFSWDESERALVLAAVYWLMWASHLIGGVISLKFRSKVVIGYSILFGSAFSFIIPISAIVDYKLLMTVRVIQGFVVGLAFPSINAVIPYWIPVNERGKFLTVFLGINLGTAVANFLGALIINLLNWEAVFYVTGSIGVVWCCLWKYLMYDRPQQHPRISEEELTYITQMTSATLNEDKNRPHEQMPWSNKKTSSLVIINTLVQFGTFWSLNVIIIYGPMYIKLNHDLDIISVGICTSVPFLLRIPASIGYSAFADKLIEKRILSKTKVRKLSTFISNVLSGTAFWIMIYGSERLWIVLISMSLAVILSGATISGAVAGLIDISPTYGGILQGIAGAPGMLTGILIPLIVSALSSNNDIVSQWWYIFFLISGAICVLSTLPFLLFWESTEIKEQISRGKNIP